MTEIATTSTATPPPPLVAAPPPAAASATPPAAISDAAYDGVPEADQGRFARVRKGPDGGSEWRERSTLQSETAPPDTRTGQQPNAAATVTEAGLLKVGNFELTEA